MNNIYIKRLNFLNFSPTMIFILPLNSANIMILRLLANIYEKNNDILTYIYLFLLVSGKHYF